MLKMVLGMAMDKYDYDPEKLRNYATGDNKNSITARLAALGYPVSSDTVRDYLKEAVEKHGNSKTG